MSLLRILLIIANTAASLVLLAVPIGKLLGVIEETIDAAAISGWLMFFIPLFASAFGLCGIHLSRSAFARPFVIIAMPGSFLMAFVSVLTTWNSPSNFSQVGIAAAVLLTFNVLILWKPFTRYLASSNNRIS